jgi:hypothetical protein
MIGMLRRTGDGVGGVLVGEGLMRESYRCSTSVITSRWSLSFTDIGWGGPKLSLARSATGEQGFKLR